jgi:hypothetical protein
MSAPEQKTLMDGMFDEMSRAREILKMYEEIPQGAFGASMIRQTIQRAEQAIKDNDVVEMVISFQQLKEIQ